MKKTIVFRVSHMQLVQLIIDNNWLPNKAESELDSELFELTVSLSWEGVTLEERLLKYCDYVINNGALSSEISDEEDLIEVQELISEEIIKSCVIPTVEYR